MSCGTKTARVIIELIIIYIKMIKIFKKTNERTDEEEKKNEGEEESKGYTK